MGILNIKELLGISTPSYMSQLTVVESLAPANDSSPNTLKETFNALQNQFFEDMKTLQKGPNTKAFPFLKNIPNWDPAPWRKSKSNNCYNFSLNRYTNDYLLPGQLASPPVPRDRNRTYEQEIIFRCKKDNLRPLKKSFMECLPDEMPLAVFLKPPSLTNPEDKDDFHWVSLRQMKTKTGQTIYVWTGKPGPDAPQLCPKKKPFGHVDIFKAAAKDGYIKFGGFMAAPVTLQQPPTLH